MVDLAAKPPACRLANGDAVVAEAGWLFPLPNENIDDGVVVAVVVAAGWLWIVLDDEDDDEETSEENGDCVDIVNGLNMVLAVSLGLEPGLKLESFNFPFINK